ncbi:J domain-containing protein [Synechococcus sp. BL107]|uniref:J domain-containing protein n=1 Tax=Synechococcus sp. BL107 TaxID=313625 RepID=UPI0018DD55FE|nr:J domain-containing protein [Synechococcus sp. BL107]
MTSSTFYFRNDGYIFVITGQYGDPPRPLQEAAKNSEKKNEYLFIDMYMKGKKSRGEYTTWECSEYIPGDDCDDKSNFWVVAASARRTGRFAYGATRKSLKQFIEGPDIEVPWIYAVYFDQFTEEYEARYRARVEQAAEDRRQSNEWSKRNTYRIEFDINDFVSSASGKSVDHYDVLGLEKNAGPRQIKHAYWTLAKSCHPDLNPNDVKAAEKFKMISESYQQLIRKFSV